MGPLIGDLLDLRFEWVRRAPVDLGALHTSLIRRVTLLAVSLVAAMAVSTSSASAAYGLLGDRGIPNGGASGTYLQVTDYLQQHAYRQSPALRQQHPYGGQRLRQRADVFVVARAAPQLQRPDVHGLGVRVGRRLPLLELSGRRRGGPRGGPPARLVQTVAPARSAPRRGHEIDPASSTRRRAGVRAARSGARVPTDARWTTSGQIAEHCIFRARPKCPLHDYWLRRGARNFPAHLGLLSARRLPAVRSPQRIRCLAKWEEASGQCHSTGGACAGRRSHGRVGDLGSGGSGGATSTGVGRAAVGLASQWRVPDPREGDQRCRDRESPRMGGGGRADTPTGELVRVAAVLVPDRASFAFVLRPRAAPGRRPGTGSRASRTPTGWP